MTYRFWLGITIFYFALLVLAAIWEGGAALTQSGLFGTAEQYPSSPAAGAYSKLLSLLTSANQVHIPGGINPQTGVEYIPETGIIWPWDFMLALLGIFTLDYAFFNQDGWGQAIRWLIVILWLGPIIARAMIFSISWLLNRRSV